MARVLRMPTTEDLPPGTVRDFVELLFAIYRAAHRPTLREISSAAAKGDHRGTASTETVRRMLRGDTVPAHWETVEAVVEALCALASWDADGPWKYEGHTTSARKHALRYWHRALDEPEKYYVWSDEAPF